MKTETKAAIGSVSSGTLKPEDLKDAFEDCLSDFPSFHETYVDEQVERLIEFLGERAPDYCYFGALEGDGADFGFWPLWDAIEDGIQDGEISKVVDSSDDSRMTDYLLVVNDHGNTTLYGSYDEETDSRPKIWAIV